MKQSKYKRLHPNLFKVPIDKVRMGYYTDKYFTRFVEVLKKDKKDINVIYQFFPRKDSVIVGIDEALAILKYGTGYYKDEEKAENIFNQILKLEKNLQDAASRMDKEDLLNVTSKKWDLRMKLNELWVDKWNDINIKALYDGDRANNMEPVLVIEGNPKYFGHLETLLLGVLSRATSTATSTKKVVEAANGKPITFFSARFDHFWVQTTDGYAALKAGAFGVSTDANADYWGIESMGTIPHALIASYDGSTADAAIAFDKHIKPEINRLVLVDWDNDVVETTFDVIKNFYEYMKGEKFIEGHTDPSEIIGSGKGKIWGVRFDTSGQLRDKSVTPRDKNSLGVNPELVWKARKIFDKNGLKDLKIMVSGGFNEEKIKLFEMLDVPVDLYGVGSSLLKTKVDFTADIVEVNNKPCAKFGREKGDYSRLTKVPKEYWAVKKDDA
ncbi:nicotinate phosphoribosyltransferase [Geotoga petraea]|jgi:nicotinate phosphoribosyltransferase|uniref:nicotinate phosphoribosyltransferase n=1 Tax=Geotoga petraea TaxID=28234 RepID=A0A1G6JI17_9BACT|nr:nicotinate phosphoribosyltransferase [Geotoga petraea]TGG88221.1 nicotinate phosphoribosyltransferase [Geotoga petraea]SDC18095.1 nicotinate phosphoribosyltransferase [Geotoga petraea]